MKFIFKEQLYFSLAIFLGLLLANYFYTIHKNLETENNTHHKRIEQIFCHSSKGLTPEIKIIHRSKLYSVSINRDDCGYLKMGNSIDLLYNKELDYFFIKNKSKTNKIQMTILLISLLTSFLPFKKWFS